MNPANLASCPCVDVEAVANRSNVTPSQTHAQPSNAKPTTTAPYAIALLIATLFAYVVTTKTPVVLAKDDNLASSAHADDRECNEMQPN